jgi:FHS family glucose/mannose:H+ symporter-like MFS transporter
VTSSDKNTAGRTLAVLHPAFALTGVLHAMGGPLLPSLAHAFRLSDERSGSLFLFYFAGTSLGALLCRRNYARLIAFGFVGVSGACLGIEVASQPMLPFLFLLLGISVGVPMSAVSMFAGRRFAAQSAAPLTLLNFSWSAGALMAPLLAAQLLVNHTYRAAYIVMAGVSAMTALVCWLLIEEPPESLPASAPVTGICNLRFIALFAFLTSLEVGIENTTISWLATYSLRSSGSGEAMAAVSSSVYWWGFLASRGISSLMLLRVEPMRVLYCAVITAVLAAALLVGLPGSVSHGAAMFVLGAALAPIFPLLLARFFARTRRTSDSRWVLAICGFGGSVLPWLTGMISARWGSLRLGLMTIPAALFMMALMLPMLGSTHSSAQAE